VELGLGFASVWTSEHLVVSPDLFDPYGDIPASLTMPSYVAAATERVRLSHLGPDPAAPRAAFSREAGGDVARPERRAAAAGVGVGWLSEEFGLLGADLPAQRDYPPADAAGVADHHDQDDREVPPHAAPRTA
jgi:hypothetical protein